MSCSTIRRGLAAAATASAVGAAALIGIAVQATPAAADTVLITPLHINFGSQSTPAVAGYGLDFGQSYDAVRGFGWTTAAGSPLSLVGNGRVRNVNADKRLDSLMQVQAANGVTTAGSWKASIPNGTYSVTVGVGDPNYVDSHDVINAEGKTILDFTPTTASRQTAATATVTVADATLNLDPTGGSNTKIDYVDIVSQAPQTAGPTHVNFGDQTTPAVSGYALDYGQPFSSTTGFGWEDNGTGGPMSYVGNSRERNVNPNKLADTFMQMQASGGNRTTGRWETVVPNGSYTVTVGVGDPSYFDSHDVINAEGVRVIDFAPATGNRQTVGTVNVTVADGRLTIDPVGGSNTKIDYVDVVPYTAPSSAVLTVTSPEDTLQLGTRMVFSTVANESRAGHSITLINPGTSALNVSNLTFAGANPGDFRLCSGQLTSFAVAPGSSAPVCVQYRPLVNAITNGTQVSRATLTIASNDPTSPNFAVSLGGLNSENYEGRHEPSLQQIITALGYTTNAAVTDLPQKNSVSGTSRAVGDEVLSPYWKALDASKGLQLVPLAQYASKSTANSPSFGWYAKGSSTNNYLYAFPGGADASNGGYGQNQILVPIRTESSTHVNTLTFTPTGSFGIVDNYPGYGTRSDDAQNVSGWHNLRFYLAKDASGNVIPGSYILGNDLGRVAHASAKNFDYQDFVFLLTNAQPDTSTAQPAPGEDTKVLSSFPGGAGGIAGSGFANAQGAVDISKISLAGGTLQITGSNDPDTTHANALQLPVNSSDPFRLTSRLVGTFGDIDAGAESQGIYYGPDASNYLRLALDWNSGDASRHLTLSEVVSGVTTVLTTTALPGADPASVDLRIDIVPAPAGNTDPTVAVAYALNGSSTFSTLNPTATMTFPPAWLTATTPAGVMTSSLGGAPFVARYASFGVARNF